MSVAYKDYWLKEAVRGTQTIESTAMYKLGGLPKSGKRPIKFNTAWEVNVVEQLGIYYPSHTAGNKYAKRNTLNYIPFNGVPFYHMLGDSGSDDGVHTVIPFSAARKPAKTLWNDDALTKHYCKGNVAMALEFTFEIGNNLEVFESCMGMSNGKSTETPTLHADVYPSAVATPWNRLLTCSWDGDDYTPAILKGTMQQQLTGYPADSTGFYGEICENSPIAQGVTIVFSEGEDVSAIIADKLDPTKEMVLKFGKADDASMYLELTYSNMCCLDVQEDGAENLPQHYVGIFVGGEVSVAIKDGVADAFYDD